MRNFQDPGRSTVHGENGVAATSSPLATLAAIEILKEGGNAFDAAVAASAVLCVVEPMSTGIGGDCFVLFSEKGQTPVQGLNGSGRAPSALTAEMIGQTQPSRISHDSIHSVTIPGAVDAWCLLLEQHGKLGLERALEPACQYAEQGFVVPPVTADAWARLADFVGRTEDGRSHLTLDGRAPRTGEKFHSPALGRTLRQIQAEGRNGFYRGDVAEDMVKSLRALGGCHTLEDFDATAADFVAPIQAGYREHNLYEIPPNGQGITALLMLNILEGFDLANLPAMSADRIHLEMEAQRLAYEFRDQFIADPGFSSIPVQEILSAQTAEKLCRRIDLESKVDITSDVTTDLARDTVYLNVIDRDLNAVSFINSLYMGFGSGYVSRQSGVTFQNRGAGFVIDPKHPNHVEGGKRPLHTIIPGMLTKSLSGGAERVLGPIGVMGGDYQPVGHTHVVCNLIDYAMDPQEALDLPRTFYQEDELVAETGVPSTTIETLEGMGHKVKAAEMPFGGGQIALIDWENGTLVAGSEPRKDGCALAF